MSNTRNLGELLQSDGEVPSSKIDSIAATKLTGTIADARLSSTRQASKLLLTGGAMTGAITTDSTFDTRDVSVDGNKLDGIASGANLYVHPNHSGDVVSTADGETVIQVDAVDIPMLSASGTASSTTFLRGDNTWGVPIGGVTSVNSVTGAITTAHIAAAVEAASDSNTFTDADHTKLNTIEASATADQSASEIKTHLENGIDSVHYVDGSIDDVHLATGISATKLTGTIADARFPATLPAISGASLTGITGTTTRIHAFSTNAAGDLIWTHSENSLDLQTGSGVDIYKDVVIGSSDQVYSINSDGQLICTFT